MDEYLLKNANYISLSVFLFMFIVMATWEVFLPKRFLRAKKSVRWLNNIFLTVINTFILRFAFPLTLLGWTQFAQEQNWGILNYLQWPFFLEVGIAFVVFDFAIYLQHVLVHFVPLLWRLHQVHHADLDLDVTSGARFHTIEMILSMLVKFSLVVLLGPSLLAVLIFEVVLNAAAMFNHSNVNIPMKLDKFLRWAIVTPDMHRVHHSKIISEANTNFGFNLPWWDRLFGTYLSEPKLGQENMNIGLSYVKNEKEASQLWSMLKMPFTNSTES